VTTESMSEADRPSVSVVIPVHNGGENFLRCLQALRAADPPPLESVVVADGDTSGSALMADTFASRVLRTSRRRGPAHARNLGASEARGDVVLFLDADVLIRRDTIGRVAEVFQQDPGLAAVFGSYDDAPAAANFFSQVKNLFHHYVHQTASEEASTFWSGCGAIRRTVFLTMGGFDERYTRPLIEDIELGYRLRREGHRIRLCKALQVKHLKEWGAISLLKSDFFDRALPWTDLILSRQWLIGDLNLKPSSQVSTLLTGALILALLGAVRWTPALLLAGVAVGALLALNAPLYSYFLHKRGALFALKAIPCHWFYFVYSGVAFITGAILHVLGIQLNAERDSSTGIRSSEP
jgi:glycosyltransferase involved in cell wall biosynthesis